MRKPTSRSCSLPEFDEIGLLFNCVRHVTGTADTGVYGSFRSGRGSIQGTGGRRYGTRRREEGEAVGRDA